MSALYLFCFARGRDLSRAPEGTGLDRESPLELERCEKIVAVVSAAALDEFTGEEAESRMRDLAWLAPRALLHERVIEQVAILSPVLPARMGTIFSSREKLLALMHLHQNRILAFLDRTAGQDEWAVKIFLDRKQATETRVADELARMEPKLSATPGTRYLQEQRIRSQAERAVSEWVDETTAEIRDRLTPLAADVVERKLLPPGTEGLPGQMVANWAFLIDRESAAGFRARVRDLDEEYQPRGLRLQEAGAWPPYSFTPALATEADESESARDR